MSFSEHVPNIKSQNIIYDDLKNENIGNTTNIVITHTYLTYLLTFCNDNNFKCKNKKCAISFIKGYTNDKLKLPCVKNKDICLICYVFLNKPLLLNTDPNTNLSLNIEFEYGFNKLNSNIMSFSYLYDKLFVVNNVLYYYQLLKYAHKSIYDIKENVVATFPGVNNYIEIMYNFTRFNKTLCDTNCRRYVTACLNTVNIILQKNNMTRILIIEDKEIILDIIRCNDIIECLYSFIQLSCDIKKIRRLFNSDNNGINVRDIRIVRLHVLYIIDLFLLYKIYISHYTSDSVLNVFSINIPNSLYNESYLNESNTNRIVHKIHNFIQRYRKTIKDIVTYETFLKCMHTLSEDNMDDIYFISNLYKTIILKSMTMFSEDGFGLIELEERVFFLSFPPLLLLYVLCYGYIHNQVRTKCPLMYSLSLFITKWIRYIHISVNVINSIINDDQQELSEYKQYYNTINHIRKYIFSSFKYKSDDDICDIIYKGYHLEDITIYTQQNRASNTDVLSMYDQAYRLKQPSFTHIINIRDTKLMQYISDKFELDTEFDTKDPSNTNQFLRLGLWIRYIYQSNCYFGIPLSVYMLFVKQWTNKKDTISNFKTIRKIIHSPLTIKNFEIIKKSIETKNKPTRSKSNNTMVLNNNMRLNINNENNVLEKTGKQSNINKKLGLNERLIYDIYPSITNKIDYIINIIETIEDDENTTITKLFIIQACIQSLSSSIPALMLHNIPCIIMLVELYNSLKYYKDRSITDKFDLKVLKNMLTESFMMCKLQIEKHALEIKFNMCCVITKETLWNELINTFIQIKQLEVISLSYEDIYTYESFYYCNLCKYSNLYLDKQGKIIQNINNEYDSVFGTCKICLSTLSVCKLCIGQVVYIYYKNIKSKHKSGAIKKDVYVSNNNITERQSIIPPAVLSVTLCYRCKTFTPVNEDFNFEHKYYCKNCYTIETDGMFLYSCIKIDVNVNCSKELIAIPVVENDTQKWIYMCTNCYVQIDYLSELKEIPDLISYMSRYKLKFR